MGRDLELKEQEKQRERIVEVPVEKIVYRDRSDDVVQSAGNDKKTEELQTVIMKMEKEMDKMQEQNKRLTGDLEQSRQDVVQSAGNEKKTVELQGSIMKMEKEMDKMQEQNKRLTGDLEHSRQE